MNQISNKTLFLLGISAFIISRITYYLFQTSLGLTISVSLDLLAFILIAISIVKFLINFFSKNKTETEAAKAKKNIKETLLSFFLLIIAVIVIIYGFIFIGDKMFK